jgi:FAD/FMN-containing dehydrogenase
VKDTGEVVAAVALARARRLPLSVRGGGHDWAGRAMRDGGLVIDLSAMRRVVVDPEKQIATALGGATVGDVVAAAQAYGLAPVTGTVRAVGMAGLVLGGGYGPLNGKHGMALDSLVGAEVVLADGRSVIAGETADAELLWGLRGGGGGFGVVTSARYRLHRLAMVLAGFVFFPIAQAATIWRNYRELIATAPDELTMMTGFVPGGDGKPVVFMYPMWSGDLDTGARVMNQVQHLGSAITSSIGPVTYDGAMDFFDAHVVEGRHHRIRVQSVATLTDDVASLLIEAARSVTSAYSAVTIHHSHGAASRVPLHETAFGVRQDHLVFEIIAAWEATAPGDVHRRWADGLSDTIAPLALPGGYANMLAPEERERARLAYGANAERLVMLKGRYDPEGMFSSTIGVF